MFQIAISIPQLNIKYKPGTVKYMQKEKTLTVQISYKTIVFFVLFILSLYAVFALRSLFMGLFISILLATGLNPIVTFLEKFKIPRPAAILIVYITILASVSVLIATVIPPLVGQTASLLNSLPLNYISDSFKGLEVSLDNLQIITSQLGSFSPVLRIVSSTFSGMVTFFTFAVITFYLLLERKNLRKHIADLSPNIESEQKAEDLISKVETQIGSWVRGQVILMLAVGLVTYIGLTLLNISFALPLAIIAGLLEIIPNIGPTVSSVPAIIVPIVIDQNPIMAVFVIALYVLIQQLENHLLVPRVMQSAVGIHPLVTIISIIVGLQLAGVGGAIMAVPLFLVAKVFFVELIWPEIKGKI